MGSQHTYDLGGTKTGAGTKRRAGHLAEPGVEVALDPEELAASALDPEALRRKYEQHATQASSSSSAVAREDFSDLVAEHAGKQAAKKSKREDEKKKAQFKF